MAIGVGSRVFYNDATFSTCIADVIANNAGVCNLLVYYPNGQLVHKANVAGAASPAAGQYDSDTFPTVQAS